MIRKFTDSDLPVLVKLVQQDTSVQQEEIEGIAQGGTTWVYLNGDEVVAVAAVVPVRKEADPSAVTTRIYVAPEFRGKGIASRLWGEACQHIQELGVERVYTTYRRDHCNARDIFSHFGFTPWFAWHLMKYDGPTFEGVTLDVLPYTDEWFWDVVTLRNEGFRELRRQSNIQPIDVYPPGFDEAKVREAFLSDQDKIFVFVSEGRPVAFTHLGDTHIETIAVREKFRGRGYGRQVTQFSVNKLRERGVDTVFLGVLEVNKGARRLYESLGFVFVETTENARMGGFKRVNKE